MIRIIELRVIYIWEIVEKTFKDRLCCRKVLEVLKILNLHLSSQHAGETYNRVRLIDAFINKIELQKLGYTQQGVA